MPFISQNCGKKNLFSVIENVHLHRRYRVQGLFLIIIILGSWGSIFLSTLYVFKVNKL